MKQKTQKPGAGVSLSALKSALGDGCVDTSETGRFSASLDNTRISVLPEAVIRPREAPQVGQLLELANRHRVPVIPRGAGSSTTGATVPVRGGWVLDLSHWRAIRIDAESGMAHVEPGAVVGEIQRKAEAKGWFYPPDPSSAGYSTIGGNIACNAGGLRGAKYGVTRDYVLGLEGYLPEGPFVRWAGPLRKFASGYNLRDLWIGSEGTLGVITGAVLRLVPRPLARWTALASFSGETAALRAARALLKQRLVPAVLEFLDRQSVACVERAWGRPVFEGAQSGALLLIELDGHPAVLAEEREIVRSWATGRARAFREAADEADAEQLWQARRSCSRAMFQLGDSKINEDVVVPLRSYEKLLRFVRELRERTGLGTPTFGHVADGNFHLHIMYNRGDPEHRRRAEEAVASIFDTVIALGGAISGEHGIGLAKSPFLRKQHSPAEVDAMVAIKQALDPKGILNPGKIFEPFEVWKAPVTAVRLPWDH